MGLEGASKRLARPPEKDESKPRDFGDESKPVTAGLQRHHSPGERGAAQTPKLVKLCFA